jgi:hypothetical protein
MFYVTIIKEYKKTGKNYLLYVYYTLKHVKNTSF